MTPPLQSELAKVSVHLPLQLPRPWPHMSEPRSRIHTHEQRLKEWELLKEAHMDAASIRETGAAIPQLDGEDDDEASEVSMGGWECEGGTDISCQNLQRAIKQGGVAFARFGPHHPLPACSSVAAMTFADMYCYVHASFKKRHVRGVTKKNCWMRLAGRGGGQ